MSKKRKSTDVFGYYKEDEDKIENQVNDSLEDYETDEEVENADEISAADLNVDDILALNVDDLEKSKKLLSKEIITLKNGEERTRAIGDLKEIEAIMFARRRYERKKDQMSEELQLKEKELDNDLALKREEIEREFEHKQKELEHEKERLAKELALKEKEIAQNCELQEEQIKVQKRGTLIGALTNVGTAVLSFIAYGYLLNKQNQFESGDNYSTSGSRGLTNNISRIPSVFGKH